jgi:hypothetical protein
MGNILIYLFSVWCLSQNSKFVIHKKSHLSAFLLWLTTLYLICKNALFNSLLLIIFISINTAPCQNFVYKYWATEPNKSVLCGMKDRISVSCENASSAAFRVAAQCYVIHETFHMCWKGENVLWRDCNIWCVGYKSLTVTMYRVSVNQPI